MSPALNRSSAIETIVLFHVVISDKINMHMSTYVNHTLTSGLLYKLYSHAETSHKEKGDTSLNSGLGGLLCLGDYCGNALLV